MRYRVRLKFEFYRKSLLMSCHKNFNTVCTNRAVIETRFKYYCFLGLYWTAQYDSLQPHICVKIFMMSLLYMTL